MRGQPFGTGGQNQFISTVEYRYGSSRLEVFAWRARLYGGLARGVADIGSASESTVFDAFIGGGGIGLRYISTST